MSARPPLAGDARRQQAASVFLRAAATHRKSGQTARAIEAYRKALNVDPDSVAAMLDLGNLLSVQGAWAEAQRLYQRAVLAKPDAPEAHYNLANALRHAGDGRNAIAHYMRALELRPVYPSAQFNLGQELWRAGEVEDAQAAYRRVMSLEPNHLGACHMLLKIAMGSGDFAGAEEFAARIPAAVAAYSPQRQDYEIFANIAYDHIFYPLPDETYRRLTGRIGEILAGRFARLPGRPTAKDPERRLKIGYLSPNWGDHPVGHVFRSFFAQHDRAQVEVFGYATRDRGGDRGDFNATIRAGFDHYRDLGGMPAVAAAHRIAEDDIDILVDLDGYMELVSPQILSQRPARLQAFWVGHAGGLGLPCVDYLLADATVIPQGAEGRYSEAIVRLPEIYHPMDRAPIAAETPSRAAEGLGEDAIVFCAFNNPEKIDRRAFASWMRILAAVPNSQLWLSDRRKYADPRPRLRGLAKAAGIAPERIVFARYAPDKAAHLARHRLADLFLDTFTLNASSTALDALWAGVPVVTWAGDRFATRIAASFLNAAGLADLITSSLDEYEAKAIALARDPAAVQALKARLVVAREVAPLFDTARLARHVEDAYRTMWRRYVASEPVAAFNVPARERPAASLAAVPLEAAPSPSTPAPAAPVKAAPTPPPAAPPGAASPAWKPGTPLAIATPRYVLRSLRASDVDETFVGWAADPEVMVTLNLPPRQITREDLVKYVERFDNRARFGLGVFDKDSKKLIGFYAVYCDMRNGLAQTNVCIGDRDYWGKKVVLETRGALIDFLFGVLKVNKIWGTPLARNFPSLFNYKAQGFTCEGVLRQHRRSFSGGWLDQYMFGLLRSEWLARKQGGGQ
ncbi:MAG TPA: GNAT family N-acetyltransferase [Alphaproteobacteria bacterium]|nr:GNAT family N-acetyltransferase [Alphaproteobacteria bacterium]